MMSYVIEHNVSNQATRKTSLIQFVTGLSLHVVPPTRNASLRAFLPRGVLCLGLSRRDPITTRFSLGPVCDFSTLSHASRIGCGRGVRNNKLSVAMTNSPSLCGRFVEYGVSGIFSPCGCGGIIEFVLIHGCRYVLASLSFCSLPLVPLV